MNVLLLTVLLAAAGPRFEAKTLDGQTFAGRLTELNAQRLTLQTPQGAATVPIEKLVDLSIKPTPSSSAGAKGIRVQLMDGSVVCAGQYTCRGDRATLTLLDGQVLELPVHQVLAVRLQTDATAAAEWAHLVKTKRDTDLLVVRKSGALDYQPGVAHEVTAETVRFDLEGEVVSAPRGKIFGLVYHHRLEGDAPAACCRITDLWGSQWSAHKLRLADRLQWTTWGGAEVSLPLGQVVDLDFSGGKIAYLSDLEAESVRWTPFFAVQKPLPILEAFYAPRRDRDFDSAPLQLGGAQYSKGLAVHARTELTYRLPDGFRRLGAVAGIDDSLRPNGKVRLVVRGDAKVLLDRVITGNDPPKPLELDVAGVRRLVILVDFVDGVPAGDQLLLCNARITK